MARLADSRPYPVLELCAEALRWATGFLEAAYGGCRNAGDAARTEDAEGGTGMQGMPNGVEIAAGGAYGCRIAVPVRECQAAQRESVQRVLGWAGEGAARDASCTRMQGTSSSVGAVSSTPTQTRGGDGPPPPRAGTLILRPRCKMIKLGPLCIDKSDS